MRQGLAGWVALMLVFAAAWAQASDLAIVGAKVYVSPDAAPIERGTVLVSDGRITEVGPVAEVRVPKGATVISGRGAVVVAGFWNSHVHFLQPSLLAAETGDAAALGAALDGMLTRWGFTTVFDIGSVDGNALALRRRIANGEVRGPMILTTDAAFYPRNGTPIYVRDFYKTHDVPSGEVASAKEAVARADAQLAAGADGVKLFTGAIVGGKVGVLAMNAEIASATVAAAHRMHKTAFAHPSNDAGLDVAIAAGVDVLAHTTPETGPWSAERVQRLHEKSMALVPTLTLFEVELAKENVPADITRRVVGHAQQQVKAYSDAGGQVLFGTDIGYIDTADTTREYQLLAEAGLDWRQVLASLTTAPAQRFGYSDRKGRVAAGLDADLVVLAADPAGDAAAFAKVRYTIRDGRVLYDAAQARATPSDK